MAAAIGIDLGTTNTVVAVVVDGIATTLEDEHGRRLIPSIVSFDESGNTIVGEMARERRVVDPAHTVYSTKRLIGRAWSSPEVSEARRILPFRLKEGPKESVLVEARNATYGLPELSAFVLRRAKQVAEQALGEPVERAVITVPASFNELQRASTKVSGRLAGLEILRVLNEPTAAALAYGQAIKDAARVAVFDLGGGTFDITVLDLTKDVFEVLSTSGDTSLGGDDFDARIAVHIAELCAEQGYDPRGRPEEFARLKLLAEAVKIDLSKEREINRMLSVVDPNTGKQHNIELSLTRTMLERLVSPLVDRTLEVTKRSLMSAGLSARDIDQVILVGGSTRMPVVSASVATLFGKQPTSRINPDEVVALGAAIQAHALNKDRAKRPNVVLAKKEMPPQRPKTQTILDMAPPPVVVAPAARAEPIAIPDAAATVSNLASVTASLAGVAAVHAAVRPPTTVGTYRMSSAPPAGAPEPTVEMAIPRRAPTLSFEIEDPRYSDTPPPPPPFAAKAPAQAPGFKPAGSYANAAPVADPASATFKLDFGAFETSPKAPAANLSSTARIAGAPNVLPTTEDGSVATRPRTALLIDVTPLSLRVETVGGYSDILIAANTPVPCERTRVFLTSHDNQVTATVRVAQGEITTFADNTRLGELELSGIRASSRGDVKILVTFELDADGTLNVSAKEDGTLRIATAKMHLNASQNDPPDVEAMMARQNARPVIG
jgi:molecular chaperone DnaK